MFEALKRLYKAGKISPEKLENAVKRGWITEAEQTQIINEASA